MGDPFCADMGAHGVRDIHRPTLMLVKWSESSLTADNPLPAAAAAAAAAPCASPCAPLSPSPDLSPAKTWSSAATVRSPLHRHVHTEAEGRSRYGHGRALRLHGVWCKGRRKPVLFVA
jgi:hypothetical protein